MITDKMRQLWTVMWVFILFFQKVKEYLDGSSLISKLQAKHDLLKEAIQKGTEKAIFQSRKNKWKPSYTKM